MGLDQPKKVNVGGLNLVQDPGGLSKVVSQAAESILGFPQQVLKLKLWCLGFSAGNNMLDFRGGMMNPQARDAQKRTLQSRLITGNQDTAVKPCLLAATLPWWATG